MAYISIYHTEIQTQTSEQQGIRGRCSSVTPCLQMALDTDCRKQVLLGSLNHIPADIVASFWPAVSLALGKNTLLRLDLYDILPWPGFCACSPCS